MEEKEENSKKYIEYFERAYRYFKEIYLFSLNSNFKKAHLENDNRISEDLEKKFVDNKYLLSSNAKFSSIGNNEWRIKDRKAVYIIRESDNQLNIYKKREKEEKNTTIRFFVFEFPKINYFVMGVSICILSFIAVLNIFLAEDRSAFAIIILLLALIFIKYFHRIMSSREEVHNYYYNCLKFEVKLI